VAVVVVDQPFEVLEVVEDVGHLPLHQPSALLPLLLLSGPRLRPKKRSCMLKVLQSLVPNGEKFLKN
jgi:hypothetical protein